VWPEHHDLTGETNKHKEEREIVAPGLPIENSEEPHTFS